MGFGTPWSCREGCSQCRSCSNTLSSNEAVQSWLCAECLLSLAKVAGLLPAQDFLPSSDTSRGDTSDPNQEEQELRCPRRASQSITAALCTAAGLSLFMVQTGAAACHIVCILLVLLDMFWLTLIIQLSPDQHRAASTTFSISDAQCFLFCICRPTGLHPSCIHCPVWG